MKTSDHKKGISQIITEDQTQYHVLWYVLGDLLKVTSVTDEFDPKPDEKYYMEIDARKLSNSVVPMFAAFCRENGINFVEGLDDSPDIQKRKRELIKRLQGKI